VSHLGHVGRKPTWQPDGLALPATLVQDNIERYKAVVSAVPVGMPALTAVPPGSDDPDEGMAP